MRKLLGNRKRKLTTGAVLTTLALATVAIAFWASTGEGPSETEAKPGTAFEVKGQSPAPELYPGGTGKAKVKFKNVEAAGRLKLVKVSASVKEVGNEAGAAETEAEAATHEKCYKPWFSIAKVDSTTGSSAEPNEFVEHGLESAEHTATVEMTEKENVNQNGCKSQKVTVTLKAEP